MDTPADVELVDVAEVTDPDDDPPVEEQLATGQALALRYDGTVIRLDRLDEVGIGLDTIREIEAELRLVKRRLQDAVGEHRQRTGERTIRVNGVELVVDGGEEVEYDLPLLRRLLAEAGMPAEHVDRIVRPVDAYKLDTVALKTAAKTNPDFQAAVDLASTRRPKPWSVKVTRSRT